MNSSLSSVVILTEDHKGSVKLNIIWLYLVSTWNTKQLSKYDWAGASENV